MSIDERIGLGGRRVRDGEMLGAIDPGVGGRDERSRKRAGGHLISGPEFGGGGGS